MSEPFHAVLVVSDNEAIVKSLIDILARRPELTDGRTFEFACFYQNEAMAGKDIGGYTVRPLNMKTEYQTIIDSYDLVISAHCKQIFPDALVAALKCINVHPGLNPHNRGWYPQVFSIINKLPLGATIHVIDEKLDHGEIIAQEPVSVEAHDTSLTAYNKVQAAEIRLMESNLEDILNNGYSSIKMSEEGNLNLKKDFEALRHIDPDETVTFGEAIDRLRALTHPPFKNAYFIDPSTGEKILIAVTLEKES